MTETITRTDRLAGYELGIPPDHLHPNPDNPRLEAGDVSELAQSIQEQGLLEALLVRPAIEFSPCRLCEDKDGPCPGHFWIEAGYRRWVAMRPWAAEIRCHVWPHVLTGEEAVTRNLFIGLIENVHRQDLDAIEKARSFGRLRDERHLSMAEIARQTGFHSSTVSTSLALLELTPVSQERIRAGTLGTTEALKIVRRHRRTERKKKHGGSGIAGARWEPDWFTRKHPLAFKAEVLCNARNHNGRRRLGGVACGYCFEEVIRDDQKLIEQLNFQDSVRGVLSPPPVPPWTPETPALREGMNGGH